MRTAEQDSRTPRKTAPGTLWSLANRVGGPGLIGGSDPMSAHYIGKDQSKSRTLRLKHNKLQAEPEAQQITSRNYVVPLIN